MGAARGVWPLRQGGVLGNRSEPFNSESTYQVMMHQALLVDIAETHWECFTCINPY